MSRSIKVSYFFIDATHLLLILLFQHLISFKYCRSHGLERHGWQRKALLHMDVHQRGLVAEVMLKIAAGNPQG